MTKQEQQKKVPTTKQELIAMLKEQLEKVQDDINEMQDTLEQERRKRKQLTVQLQEKQAKIQQLLQNQSKTLGDKVNQGLYNTLDTANKMRAQAEAQIRRLAQDNSVLNQKIVHRDSKIIEDRKAIDLNIKKVSVLQSKKVDLQRKQQNLIDKKEQMKKKYDIMKKQHERIQREQFQLRNHIQNMKKLRMYLNKNLEGGVLKNANNIIGSKSRVNKNNSNDNFWN